MNINRTEHTYLYVIYSITLYIISQSQISDTMKEDSSEEYAEVDSGRSAEERYEDYVSRLYKVSMQVMDKGYTSKYEEKILEKKTSLGGHPDSGFDLFVPEDVVIPAGEIRVIDMKVKCAVYEMVNNRWIPSPYYLYPRSSVTKRGIMLANSVGIIDCGYRGHLMTGFYNTKKEDVTILAGDRIAQICMPDLCPYYEVELAKELDITERNEGGFGSTGR